MKDDVLDVLVYLLDHYLIGGIEPKPYQELLSDELRQAGFDVEEINKAFTWLDDLKQKQFDAFEVQTPTFRIFTPEELAKIGIDGQGFIYQLESMGVLKMRSREMLIEQLMTLESKHIDLEDIKWVALFVLCSQEKGDFAYVWLQHLMFDFMEGKLH